MRSVPPAPQAMKIEAAEPLPRNVMPFLLSAVLPPLYYRVSAYLCLAFVDDPAWLAFWFC